MPKVATKAEFNYFVKGIITEASPLNFPENASIDEENYDIDRKGTRYRRLGMDLEEGATFRTLTSQSSVEFNFPSVFKWIDAGGLPNQDFAVIQEGNTFHFYDMIINKLSSEGYKGSITLTDLPSNAAYSLAAVDGRLVVACGGTKQGLITYVDGVFASEYFTIKTRDLWGIQESIDLYDSDRSYRGPLSVDHYYNLQNQSWGVPRKTKENTLADPVTYYFSAFSKAPSNSETVWPGLQYQPVASGQEPFERIYTNLYEEVLGATTKAPKGYYIIDVLDRGESRATAFRNNNQTKYPVMTYKDYTFKRDRTTGGCSIVKEFAGRMWYAGFSGVTEEADSASPDLSGYVFFSQLVKSKQDYAKCYQEGDPTSRENSDIVDTDGGFIRIAGASRIISFETIGDAIVVLANNGVWAIIGGSDYGFTATNYRVIKLTEAGCIATKSIVTDGDRIMYWADDAIYLVSFNDNGALKASPMTEQTIKTLYQDIDNFSKENCKAVYDTLSKKIKWLYRTESLFTGTNTSYELILDLTLGAFYRYRLFNDTNGLYEVIQGFDTNKFSREDSNVDVNVASDSVLSSSNNVVINIGKKSSSNRNVRYLVLKRESGIYSFSFGYYTNDEWKDWGQVDAKAYLLTGSMTAGDVSARKNVPYLFTVLEMTETGADGTGGLLNQSACTMRFQWDWAVSPDSGRWSQPQQVYRLNRVETTNLFQVGLKSASKTVITKSKIRGQGRAFAVYFETLPGFDCRLIGWNINLNGSPIA